MKSNSIRIRIDSELKNNFIKVCDFENITITNKLKQFITGEVKNKLPNIPTSLEQQIVDLIGHNNIQIVNRLIFNIDENGQVINEDITSENERLITIGCVKGDIHKYLHTNKDKLVYLYLSGSDFKNNRIRITAISLD